MKRATQVIRRYKALRKTRNKIEKTLTKKDLNADVFLTDTNNILRKLKKKMNKKTIRTLQNLINDEIMFAEALVKISNSQITILNDLSEEVDNALDLVLVAVSSGKKSLRKQFSNMQEEM